jgi:hypothetical protein
MPYIVMFSHTVTLTERYSCKEYPHTLSGIRAIDDRDRAEWFDMLDQYPCGIVLDCDTTEDHALANGAELAACYEFMQVDTLPGYLEAGQVWGVCPDPRDEGAFDEWRYDLKLGRDWLKTLTATFHIYEADGHIVEKPMWAHGDRTGPLVPDTGWIHRMTWDFDALGEPTFDQLEAEFAKRDGGEKLVNGRFAKCDDWQSHAGRRRKSQYDGNVVFNVRKPDGTVYHLYGDDRDLFRQVWVHHFWCAPISDDELIARFCPNADSVQHVRWPDNTQRA